MKISLVIPAYNEEEQIGACLDSVLAYGSSLHEIIVVDNASTDRTREIAGAYPGVSVVHETERGPTRAREAGHQAASGDLVAYIDADTRLHSEWLDTVHTIFSENPHVVSLSGPARYFDATPFERSVLALSWWAAAPLMYRLMGYMIYGANVVIRKDALSEAGGWNRSIDFYGDETELARRLRRLGKVAFRMDFFIYGSVRRFRKEGMVRTSVIYSLNYLWPALFGRPYTKTHTDVRFSP